MALESFSLALYLFSVSGSKVHCRRCRELDDGGIHWGVEGLDRLSFANFGFGLGNVWGWRGLWGGRLWLRRRLGVYGDGFGDGDGVVFDASAAWANGLINVAEPEERGCNDGDRADGCEIDGGSGAGPFGVVVLL